MAMSNTEITKDESMATVAPKEPLTKERPQETDLDSYIPKPYLCRALVTVSKEHPYGGGMIYPEHKHSNLSLLQQHASFFDRNKDGIIYPWETFAGLVAIGTNFLVAIFGALLIHIAFSYPSSTSWIPSPLLPIYVTNIHKGKHGGVTETYDREGRFEPGRFEAIFSKFAKSNPGKLSKKEMDKMLESNRNINDFFGSAASRLEWNLLFNVAKDSDDTLSKEVVRGLFDGSVFYYLEAKRKRNKNTRKNLH